jgi:large subunit ribosomal protein L35
VRYNVPKIKTRKTAAKRFKITATGKVLHGHARMNHLMIKKSSSRERRLELETAVTHGDLKKIKRMLPGT